MELEEKIEQPSNKPEKKKNFFFKHLWDFVLLGTLLIGTASVYIGRAIINKKDINQDLVATVLFEGNKMEITDSLGKNRNPFNLGDVSEYEEIEITGRHTTLTIAIKHNSICVKESGCPGQECVHEGWVSKANHPIVCAHNRIYIEIESSNWGEITQG